MIQFPDIPPCLLSPRSSGLVMVLKKGGSSKVTSRGGSVAIFLLWCLLWCNFMSLQTLWCSVFQPSLFSNHPWWWCYCQTAPKLEYSYMEWEGLLHKSLQAFREQTQLKDWASKCLQAHEIASEQALQLENGQTPGSRCHYATIQYTWCILTCYNI